MEGCPAFGGSGSALRDMVEQGRYTPGFDHLIPPDVPWANFEYAAERLRRVCYGEIG